MLSATARHPEGGRGRGRHDLSFDEFDTIESGANGAAGCSLEEGYLFGLAVGRQLSADDEPRGDEDEELAALRAVTSEEKPDPDETGGEATAQPAAG